MDTRFWGPSGWKMLHLIAEMSPEIIPSGIQKIYHKFFTNFQYLLPCKYCRKSFAKYITSLPIDNYLNSRNDLTKWIYLIHNKVNNKLRKQGYCTSPNPDYKIIKDTYQNLAISLKEPIQNIITIGHDFIGSIIINYPAYLKNNPDKIYEINDHYIEFAILFPQILYISLYKLPKNDYPETWQNMEKIEKYFQNKGIKLEKNLHEDDPSYNLGKGLLEWYYGILCTVNSKYCVKQINKFYNHFKPYIVNSCSMPSNSLKKKSKNTKKTLKNNSCRGLKKIVIY